MQRLLFYLVLLTPLITNAQFEVSYNPAFNSMSVVYTGCEICLLGTATAVNTCNCVRDCNETLSDCHANCIDEGGGIIQIAECYMGCTEDENSCLNNCRSTTSPEPVRIITGYQYTLVAAWAAVPNDPRDDQSTWVSISSPSVISNNIDPIFWNPPSPWPGVYSVNNTCYGIGIRIFYSNPDGSAPVFCDFTVWDCNFIG